MYHFDRFTPEARRVLTEAQAAAERSHHSYIGTEHLLIAVATVPDGVAAKALASLGVRLDAVQSRIEALTRRHEPVLPMRVVPTSRVKTVIELAFAASDSMGDQSVGPEHILLGLVREGSGIAAHVLVEMAGSAAAVENAVAVLRGREAPLDLPRREHTGPQELPPAFEVVNEAARIAHARGEPVVDAHHLLLALAQHDGGPVRGILESHGLSAGEIERLLDGAG